jgi:lysyl-tRNA synthetase, class II
MLLGRRCIRRLSGSGGHQSSAQFEEFKRNRIGKVNDMRKCGVNPFAYSYSPSHTISELRGKFSILMNSEEDNSSQVSIAGRLILRRFFGKLAFFEIQDHTGSIQLYIEKSRLGDKFSQIQSWTDIGLIIFQLILFIILKR